MRYWLLFMTHYTSDPCIGSHHYSRAIAVTKKSYYPSFPHPCRYFESGGTQAIGSDARCPHFLHGKLGVGVNVSIGCLQVGEKRIQACQDSV